MLNLSGKVALVTGSARGVGRAIALKLAEAGADIVVNFTDARSAADETAGRIAGFGRRVAEVQADLAEPEDIQTMVDWIQETFGRLDIVVSNLPFRDQGALLSATPADFDASMHQTVRPLILLAQAARPLLMQAHTGKIIAVSHVEQSRQRWTTQQQALSGVVSQLALELGVDGVNVNNLEIHGSADSLELATGAAGAALFLASTLSDLVQGQSICVDTQSVSAVN